jgi:hypothetical protein
VRSNQGSEVVGQLRWGKILNLMTKVLTHASDSAGVCIDGLGLQAPEFEVL